MRRYLAMTAALLLALGAGVRAEEAFYTDNVVVVLDASGSMSGGLPGTGKNKMEAAKDALIEVLTRLPHTTQVGILVFSGNNPKYRDWVYPLSPPDYPKIRAAVRGPTPGGGTPLGPYMKKGTDRLLQERQKQLGYGTYRLMVVTDGVANKPKLVDRFARDIVSRGITLDAIGVDMKGEHTLAKISHSYRKADDKASLQKAVTEIFAEIGGKGGSAMDLAGAFDLLEGLPAEAAVAMIQALANSGNHPIGTAPPPRPVPQPVHAPAATHAPAHPPAATHAVPHGPSGGHGPAPKHGKKEDKQKSRFLMILGVLVVAFMIYGSMQQTHQRPRR